MVKETKLALAAPMPSPVPLVYRSKPLVLRFANATADSLALSHIPTLLDEYRSLMKLLRNASRTAEGTFNTDNTHTSAKLAAADPNSEEGVIN